MTLRSNPYDGGPGPKGKGKGKGKRTSPPVPQELRGKWYKMANGDPICFGFNCKSGCNAKVKVGEKVPKDGMFVQSLGARRITAWFNMGTQILDRWEHPLNSSLGMVEQTFMIEIFACCSMFGGKTTGDEKFNCG